MGFSLGGLSNHGIGIDAFPGETRLFLSPWGARSIPGNLTTGHLTGSEIHELREKGFKLIEPGATWMEACQMNRAAMVDQLTEAAKQAGNDGGESLAYLVSLWDRVKSGFDSMTHSKGITTSRPRVELDQAELLDIAIKALNQLQRAQRHQNWNPGIGHQTDHLVARMHNLVPQWEKLL